MNSHTPNNTCREKHDYISHDKMRERAYSPEDQGSETLRSGTSNCWLQCISNLDMHVRAIIHSFVPPAYMVWTSKTNYIAYHSCVVELVKSQHVYDSYIRQILRNDFDYVFTLILGQNREVWWDTRKYTYRGKQYSTYMQYMDAYIFEHGSHRCRDAMFNIVYRKKHRRMNKNITWRI